ncbi:MAG: hypothetical protein ABFQ95_06025 [Pseudomonadota bacterium]
MQFEKALRRRQLLPAPLGHVEPEGRINTGTPLMDTSIRDGWSDIDLAAQQLDWPNEIILEVAWQSIKLINHSVTVQSIVPDFAFTPVSLYEPSVTGICAGIEITLRRLLSEVPQSFALNLDPGDVLWQHNFLQQNSGALVLRRRPLATGDWLVTPPKKPELANLNLLGLFAYAGFAKLGARLQDLEQVFAYITHSGDDSKLALKRYSELVAKSVAPPYGGVMGKANVVYVDTFTPKQTWSVSQVITSGQMQVLLTCDGETRAYRSVRVVEENPSEGSFSVVMLA